MSLASLRRHLEQYRQPAYTGENRCWPCAVLNVATVAVVVYEGQSVGAYLGHPKAPYLYLAGLFLAVGILAYYRALSLGPVSAVVPIFGTFLVLSSAIGVAILGESITLRKLAGVGFAVLGIYLVSGA